MLFMLLLFVITVPDQMCRLGSWMQSRRRRVDASVQLIAAQLDEEGTTKVG